MRYLILALLTVAIYAIFATHQWWTAAPKCDNKALLAEVAQLKAAHTEAAADLAEAVELQAAMALAADKVVVTTAEDFTPLKEVVREIRIDTCDGDFPDGVRDALTAATALAAESNRQLPDAPDARRAPAPSK